ncbi:hypothetical protein MBLNU230_g1919t1 [Neophaeotheca triangularis]
MPAVAEILARRAGISLDIFEDSEALLGRDVFQPEQPGILEKRIEIPCCNESSPPGLVEATTVDPFRESSKYALGWVYFAIILLVATTLVRFYHLWTDKIRVAMHKEEVEQNMQTESPDTDYELSALSTDKSTKKFFPREGALPSQPPPRQSTSSSSWMNRSIALVRYVFYRPIPHVSYRKGWRPIFFPSLGIIVIVFAALVFTILYSFVPQPLYWEKIRYGSPPLAVRSGMLAVSLMPWIVGLSMKANFISMMTGIGHERLNVLHRWLAYICLLLSLIHTIPFYVQPVWDQGGLRVFRSYFTGTGVIIYGTGVAALVPLIFLCVHSLPPLRRRFYELFVAVHVPVSIVLLGMLFWHCNNYISSWHYLYSTVAIWLASYAVRLIYLNWTNPFRMSWLIGEEAGVTIMPEDAIKVTIPTQVKWRPGHDDFPSAYGDEYRDMVLVFRPFGGFTNKVLKSALDHGPWHTYRTFIDGPYGGMARSLDSFDHVVLLAGGSGVTAVISHLLDLIKRMRDGKAVTKTVQVIWALKRPETMEWFKEELRICREFAPPDAVTCQFYITSAKRQTQTGKPMSVNTPTRPVSMFFHDQVNNVFQNIASNRFSTTSTQRHSALIQAEANGDPEREKELRKEEQDRIRPLPQAHLMPMRSASRGHLSASPNRGSQDRSPARSASPDNAASQETPHMPPHPTLHEKRRSRALTLDITSAQDAQAETLARLEEGHQTEQQQQGFDFGFPSTPTEFQKNLMRFAFMPAAVKSKKTGWSTEWGRPDIPYMLRDMSEDWTGRRACVFVCGPPAMRVDVGNTVAELQKGVWKDKGMDEVFLHTENYAL